MLLIILIMMKTQKHIRSWLIHARTHTRTHTHTHTHNTLHFTVSIQLYEFHGTVIMVKEVVMPLFKWKVNTMPHYNSYSNIYQYIDIQTLIYKLLTELYWLLFSVCVGLCVCVCVCVCACVCVCNSGVVFWIRVTYVI